MQIKSAEFIKGILGTNEILEDGIPQVAIIGRSNVGKSSLINAITGQRNLARTSPVPGRTQQMNIFFINHKVYLVDLPGYGYAKASLKQREQIQKMLYWYLVESPYEQKKVLLIIDAMIGPKDIDIQVLHSLHGQKEVVVLANKIDKLKKSELREQLQKIEDIMGCRVIPCSAKKNIGVSEIIKEILE